MLATKNLKKIVIRDYEISFRDVIMGKIQVRPLRWWAESAPPSWDRVKVSENLGATSVAPVAPADTSLHI